MKSIKFTTDLPDGNYWVYAKYKTGHSQYPVRVVFGDVLYPNGKPALLSQGESIQVNKSKEKL